MAHVSRPVLILIAATALLIAVWIVALRPKPIPVEDTPLAPTKAIPQARQAAAASDAANAKVQAASDGTANPAAQPTAAAPANAAPKAAAKVDLKAVKTGEGRNAAIVKAIASGKVVVLLFWDAKSADDIATRGALRELDLHGGKVIVKVVPIEDVAQYTAVTRGVKIAQSPTTVVVGRKGDARVIAGLSEPRELSQAVGDALAGR